MRLLVCGLAVVCLATAGCTSQPSTMAASGARTGPTGTPLAPASGQLDAEVAIPPGFPADFPIYPHARLTAGASFASPGQVAWGLEWETLDAFSKVQDYYQKKLGQGDWTVNVTGNPSAVTWAAVIGRKSDTHVQGTLAVNNDSGVNRILLSLVYPS